MCAMCVCGTMDDGVVCLHVCLCAKRESTIKCLILGYTHSMQAMLLCRVAAFDSYSTTELLTVGSYQSKGR